MNTYISLSRSKLSDINLFSLREHTPHYTNDGNVYICQIHLLNPEDNTPCVEKAHSRYKQISCPCPTRLLPACLLAGRRHSKVPAVKFDDVRLLDQRFIEFKCALTTLDSAVSALLVFYRRQTAVFAPCIGLPTALDDFDWLLNQFAVLLQDGECDFDFQS